MFLCGSLVARRTNLVGHSPVVASAALAALLGIVLLLALSSPAIADPEPATEAPVVKPIHNDDIRMEQETVQVVCYRSFAECRADFKFMNCGDSQSVRVAFPVARSASLSGFRAWVNGSFLGCSWTPAIGSYDLSYYSFDAEFPSFGETMITVTFLAEPATTTSPRFPETTPQEFASLGIPGEGKYYEYWLHTGAYWRGTIGKAVIRYQLADSFTGWAIDAVAPEAADGSAPITSPTSYMKLDDRTYQWVFEDLEPTEADDIVFAYTAPVIDPLLGWEAGKEFPAAYGAMAAVGKASESTLDWGSDGPAGFGAIDGRLSTASRWRVGTDMWLETDILGNQELKEIRILPGTGSSQGRPSSMKVDYADGTSTVIALADESTLQRFPISGQADRVRFEVLDCYRQTSRTEYVSIQEIDFGTDPAPAFRPFWELISEQGPSASLAFSSSRASSATYDELHPSSRSSGTPSPFGPVLDGRDPSWHPSAPSWIAWLFLGLIVVPGGTWALLSWRKSSA